MANKQTQSARQITDSLALNEINELIHNKKKLWWLNFQTGFIRGGAAVIGAAVVIVIIGLMVTYFGGLPIIGNFIHKIGEAAQTK
jgi:hypothetical protein